jgi:hypothetical protein
MIFKHKVEFGQDIYDVVLQHYGTLDNVNDFLELNPTLTISTILTAGQEVFINNENLGKTKEKLYFKNRTFTVMNADESDIFEERGDFNDDFNDDFNNI